jgi:hypothetical protein
VVYLFVSAGIYLNVPKQVNRTANVFEQGTAPYGAEDGYEEKALLYSATGDSTCQQEMESDVARLHVK